MVLDVFFVPGPAWYDRPVLCKIILLYFGFHPVGVRSTTTGIAETSGETNVVSTSGVDEYRRFNLTDIDPTALCLDGSTGVFWSTRHSFLKDHVVASSTKWQIYLEGGGWCCDAQACEERAQTYFGSSEIGVDNVKKFQPSSFKSNDCKINPDFCAWNRVYVHYCDGNSFVSARKDGFIVGGAQQEKRLHFRGKAILKATLNYLFSWLGMKEATEVMLVGSSAGGLATFLNADFVSRELEEMFATINRTRPKYKAVPISGFFLHTDTVLQEDVWPAQVRELYSLSQPELDPKCLELAKAENVAPYRCNFADFALASVETDIMVFNSVVDMYQLDFIWTHVGWPPYDFVHHPNPKYQAFANCSNDMTKCASDAQFRQILEGCETVFQRHFANAERLRIAANNSSPYSYFLNTCQTHGEADNRVTNMDNLKINGRSMRDALRAWWYRDEVVRLGACKLGGGGGKRQCNPTCDGVSGTRAVDGEDGVSWVDGGVLSVDESRTGDDEAKTLLAIQNGDVESGTGAASVGEPGEWTDSDSLKLNGDEQEIYYA